MATEVQRVLREAMDHRGMSIRRLAAASGVSASTVGNISKGDRITSRADTLIALANALEIDPRALLDAQHTDAGAVVTDHGDRSPHELGMDEWNRLAQRMTGPERLAMVQVMEALLRTITAVTPRPASWHDEDTGEFVVRLDDDHHFLLIARCPRCDAESGPMATVSRWMETHVCRMR